METSDAQKRNDNEPVVLRSEHGVGSLFFFFFLSEIVLLTRCSHHGDEQQSACAYVSLSDGGGEGEV